MFFYQTIQISVETHGFGIITLVKISKTNKQTREKPTCWKLSSKDLLIASVKGAMSYKKASGHVSASPLK